MTLANEVFKHSELSGYSFKERLLIKLADFFFYWLIKLIGSTLKFQTEGEKHLESIYKSGKVPIYVFWHNRIFAATYFFRNQNIVVMTSQSFDGEYIARFIQRFGYGAVRGSSTRGGVTALAKMIKLMQKGFATGFTIDGPKGPKYVAKMGACLLSKKTQNPILPLSIECEKFWEIRTTWDNLQIPKPFSRAKVFFAKPIKVDPLSEELQLEEKRLDLQRSLDELVKLGEKWRKGRKQYER